MRASCRALICPKCSTVIWQSIYCRCFLATSVGLCDASLDRAKVAKFRVAAGDMAGSCSSFHGSPIEQRYLSMCQCLFFQKANGDRKQALLLVSSLHISEICLRLKLAEASARSSPYRKPHASLKRFVIRLQTSVRAPCWWVAWKCCRTAPTTCLSSAEQRHDEGAKSLS